MGTREREGGLLEENLQLTARLQRLAPALERMARELAESRRELGLMTRENARLREKVAASSPKARSAAEEPPRPRQGRFVVTGSWCPRCGLTVDADSLHQEGAILAAGCCPRCDGQLARGRGDGRALSREPSVFLG